MDMMFYTEGHYVPLYLLENIDSKLYKFILRQTLKFGKSRKIKTIWLIYKKELKSLANEYNKRIKDITLRETKLKQELKRAWLPSTKKRIKEKLVTLQAMKKGIIKDFNQEIYYTKNIYRHKIYNLKETLNDIKQTHEQVKKQAERVVNNTTSKTEKVVNSTTKKAEDIVDKTDSMFDKVVNTIFGKVKENDGKIDENIKNEIKKRVKEVRDYMSKEFEKLYKEVDILEKEVYKTQKQNKEIGSGKIIKEVQYISKNLKRRINNYANILATMVTGSSVYTYITNKKQSKEIKELKKQIQKDRMKYYNRLNKMSSLMKQIKPLPSLNINNFNKYKTTALINIRKMLTIMYKSDYVKAIYLGMIITFTLMTIYGIIVSVKKFLKGILNKLTHGIVVSKQRIVSSVKMMVKRYI